MGFRELYVIIHSFLGAMKAICWTSLVLFILLTIFSMFAVEIIHPLNLQVADTGVYSGCNYCETAFETVFQANLFWFQTVVAGDSWGMVIIPVIKMFPATILYFVPVTIAISMGLMNLVLSVIVDQANDARAMRQLEECAHAKENLVKTCKRMDVDKSGSLSLDE